MKDTKLVDLVRSAQAGDVPAFEELVRRNFGMVYLAAWDVVRVREDAEEVAQEVFLRVFLRLDELRDPTRFAPWLRCVARSIAITHAQKENRRALLAPTIPINEEALRMADESLRETLEARDRERCVEEALRSLEIEQRELVLLYYAEGRTLKSIGEQQGVNESTAGRRLGRAMEALRAKLGAEPVDALTRFGSRRAAQARTLALVISVAGMTAPAKAALAAAAELPPVPAVSAASQASSVLSKVFSFLPSGSIGAIEGALAMGKAKAIGIGIVGIVAIFGVGVVVNDRTNGRMAAASATAVQPDASTPVPHNWFARSWRAEMDAGTYKVQMFILAKEEQGGGFSAMVYSDRALGLWPSAQLKVDGRSVSMTVPAVRGELQGKLLDDGSIEGTWNEGRKPLPIKLVAIENPPPVPLPPPRNEITVAPQLLEQFAGDYASSQPNVIPVRRRDNYLLAKVEFEVPTKFYAESPTKFFSKEVDLQLEFIRDASGNVTHLVLTKGYETPPRVSHWRRVR